jgi:hypothetical protein
MVAHLCVVGGSRGAAGTGISWKRPNYLDPVDGVLLDVNVEDQSSSRHPVCLVLGAHGREPLWCAGSDHGRSVRRPPDLGSTIRSI